MFEGLHCYLQAMAAHQAVMQCRQHDAAVICVVLAWVLAWMMARCSVCGL